MCKITFKMLLTILMSVGIGLMPGVLNSVNPQSSDNVDVEFLRREPDVICQCTVTSGTIVALTLQYQPCHIGALLNFVDVIGAKQGYRQDIATFTESFGVTSETCTSVVADVSRRIDLNQTTIRMTCLWPTRPVQSNLYCKCFSNPYGEIITQPTYECPQQEDTESIAIAPTSVQLALKPMSSETVEAQIDSNTNTADNSLTPLSLPSAQILQAMDVDIKAPSDLDSDTMVDNVEIIMPEESETTTNNYVKNQTSNNVTLSYIGVKMPFESFNISHALYILNETLRKYDKLRFLSENSVGLSDITMIAIFVAFGSTLTMLVMICFNMPCVVRRIQQKIAKIMLLYSPQFLLVPPDRNGV